MKDNSENSAIQNFLINVRNFFVRVRGLADMLDRSIPKEINADQSMSPRISSQINLMIGIRHFILGVKQICNTVETLLSDDELFVENKQLSYAALYTSDFVSTAMDGLGTFKSLVGQLFHTYNYFVPEVLLGSCVTDYMRQAYPGRAFYEYPIEVGKDIMKFIQSTNETSSKKTGRNKKFPHPTQRNLSSETDDNDALNEISYNPNDFVVHNEASTGDDVLHQPIVVANQSEVQNKTEAEQSIFDFGAVLEEKLGIATVKPALEQPKSWKKCVQFYVLEIAIRTAAEYVMG